MRLRINPKSNVPVSRQIVDSLRVLLVEGNLQAGAKLPSVRRVAIELGVHFNTVAEAYRKLAAEGWLQLRQGSGARVIAMPLPVASKSKLLEFRERLRQLSAQMRAEGITRTKIASELRSLAEEISERD